MGVVQIPNSLFFLVMSLAISLKSLVNPLIDINATDEVLNNK